VRFYANENFPRPVVERLRALGHDVLTAREAGNAGQGIPDPEVVRFARAQGRVVLTLNRRDFLRLHARDAGHEGIVVCTEDRDMAGQAERIHAAVSGAGELTGRLVRVNRPWSG
jgi:predicted nuclease of predicted toxin-antitoxin system